MKFFHISVLCFLRIALAINLKSHVFHDSQGPLLTQAKLVLNSSTRAKLVMNSSTQAKLIERETIIENQPIWLYSTPTPLCNERWNYQSHGKDWQCTCSDGLSQSPIKIKRSSENLRVLAIPAIFDFPSFSAKNAKIELSANFLKITCDATRTSCEEFIMGSIVDYDGTQYLAYEAQFHWPNEHQIDAETYDMEVQLLYKAASEGDYRKKAGFAIFIKEKLGGKNAFMKKTSVLNFPQLINQKRNFAENEEASLNEASLNFADFFLNEENPNGRSFNYYAYSGSLTSPPCEEAVKWFIKEKPAEMGSADLETLKKIVMISVESEREKEALEDVEGWDSAEIYAKKIRGNYREAKKINDRRIEFYDKENPYFP